MLWAATAMYRLLIVLVASIATTGCFSSLTLVKVRPDGSGTIELTTTVRKAALVKLDEMMLEAGHRKRHGVDKWFPEQEAIDASSRLGANVRFVSTRALDDSEVLGRITTYAFADIRELTLDMIPVLPSEGAHGSTSARFVGEPRFTFDLVDGPDSPVLTARFPDAHIEHTDAEPALPSDADPQSTALFQTFVNGARLEIAIEPELPILRTNTPHRSGQRVTLLGIDAGRIALDQGASDRLRLRPASLDELRYKLHDAAGVTVSLDREVRIELAAR